MLLALFACTGPSGGDSPEDGRSGDSTDTSDTADVPVLPDARPFTLGFTDWPYDATLEALDDTRQKASEHGDLVGLWVDAGVPWQDSLDQTWSAALDQEVTDRLAIRADDDELLMSLGFVDTARAGLATDWDGAPRSGAWADATFDDPDVVTAYTNWALHVVDLTDPTWLNLAVELGELVNNDPDDWDAAVDGYCAVYASVKAAHPDLPVFASVVLHGPDSVQATTMDGAIPDLAPCTDLAAASTYPYAFYGPDQGGDPDTLPEDWLSQIDRWLPGLPFAVAETGWLAEDLVIDEWGIDAEATADDQDRYVQRLLSEATDRDAAFVLWFTVVDYDALWEGLLAEDQGARIWRDTGLYDGDVVARPALSTWDMWLATPQE